MSKRRPDRKKAPAPRRSRFRQGRALATKPEPEAAGNKAESTVSGPRIAAIAVRREKALAMKVDGHSYRFIARELGVDVRTVFDDVQAELTEVAERRFLKAERLADIQNNRLEKGVRELIERMGSKTSTKVLVQVVRAMVRVEERRARLMGLDKPIKLAKTDPSGEHPAPEVDLSHFEADELDALEAIMLKAASRAGGVDEPGGSDNGEED